MNEQVKTNAIISYFFLGWIFLLAKNNPNFQDNFIKKHAKNATKIHLIFLIIYIIYNFFISNYLYITIPIILISINQVLGFIFFLTLISCILYGAYSAYKGEDPKTISINEINLVQKETQNTGNMNETEKIIYLSTYIPFLGLISSKKYPSLLNNYGAKIGGMFTFIIILYYALIGFDNIALLLIFIYIIVFVITGVNLIINDKTFINKFILKIYDLTDIYIGFKASIFYFIDFLKIIFGQKDKIIFLDIIQKIKKKEENYITKMQEYFTNDKIFISKYLICIPILNIIYIFKLIIDRNSKYYIAMIQGIITSIILIFIWYFYGFYSSLQILILFPIFLEIANIGNNPFYKIPIIYDIYFILDFCIFGLFSKIKFLQLKRKEVKEVKFKI